jgi:competence protein ComGA
MENELEKLLQIALRHQVTDIHLRLREDGRLRIAMRTKGQLRFLRRQELDIRFFRYLMFRSNMDLAMSSRLQTGSFEVRMEGKTIALRFAVVSSWHNTSGVLRLLNSTGSLAIEDLARDQETLGWLHQVTTHRSGLFVFSGPTGSGKTTTVYTLLNRTQGKTIFTLEDPVEVYSSRYVQIAVNEKAGMTFAAGIKQLMRHDPDIVMIGEIRDETAAAMAVRCALTGHLVLTTLHAFSCLSGLDRLEDLGVRRDQLEDVLFGISCQRLFQDPAGKHFGIYEFMDRKEVHQCLHDHQPSSGFIPLARRIQKEIETGCLEPAQAESDLFGI